MKKNKFIKYAGTSLGLLCATMSLSYGEINLNDCIVRNEFSCNSKDLQGEDAEKVLNFLINQKANIHAISITNCSLGDNFCTEFAKVLEDNTTLKRLHLSYNPIGDNGAIVLAGALQGNTSLNYLYLRRNQIGVEGAKALANVLKTTNLGGLDLSNNQIEYKGALALAFVLKDNPLLKELWLDNNKIGDEGAIALARALERNTNLKNLLLSKNQIEYQGATELVKVLTLNLLVLRYNQIIAASEKQALKDAWVETDRHAVNLKL